MGKPPFSPNVVKRKDRQVGSANTLRSSSSGASLSGFSDGSYEDLEGSVSFDNALELQVAKDAGNKSKEVYNYRRVKSAGPGTGRSRQASSSEGSPRHPLHSSLDDWLSPIQESFMSRVEAAGRIKANNSTSTLGDTESETSSHGAVDGLSPPLEHPSALPPDDEKALDGEGSIVHVHASIPRGIHVMEDEVKAGELDLRTSNWSQTELHVEGGDDSRFSMTTLGNDLEVDARHRFAATTLHATDAPPADALERQGHAAIFHHGTMQVIPSRRDMDAGALSEDWDHTMILDRGMISRMVESEGALAELDAYAHGGRPVLAAIAEESEEESAAFDTSRSLVLLPEPPVNTGSSKQHGAQTLAMSESAASLESGAATAVCDSSDEFSVSTRNGRQSIDTQSSITTVRRAVRAMLEDIVDSVADSLSLRDSRSVGGDRPGSTRTTGHRIGGYSDVGNEGNPAAAAAGLSQPLQEPEYNTETAVGLDVEHAQVCGSKLSFHSTAMCNSGPSQSSHHAQGEDDGGSESIRQDPGSPAPKKCSGHCLANKDSRQQQDRQSHQELKKRLEMLEAQNANLLRQLQQQKGVDERPPHENLTERTCEGPIDSLGATSEAILPKPETQLPIQPRHPSGDRTSPETRNHKPAASTYGRSKQPSQFALGQLTLLPEGDSGMGDSRSSQEDGPVTETAHRYVPATPMSSRKPSFSVHKHSRTSTKPAAPAQPPSSGSSQRDAIPRSPPRLQPLASGSWMSGVPGDGGRVYNVTAADLGGETSDPEVWPTPLGGPLAPPTGSASLMESRSFTGPHVGSMVGSDRKYSAKRPATHKASWAKAFELGEHLINTGSTTRELSGGLPDNLPGRRSTLDIDMQEILGQAWFGSVDGDSCLDPGLATACHRQQLSPKRQLGKVNNENAGNELHDASKAAHGSKGKSRSQRRSIAEKWVATLPPGRRPNSKTAKDLTWHFCRPTTASTGAASSVAAPPNAYLTDRQKHSDASRPATAPVACHTGLRNGAGGGGNLAAFSKRFFSAQAQASRPKSPLRCPWMRKSAKRASSAVERRALDRMASQITEDVQTLRSQPRPHTAACAAGSAFEAALAYRSRAAPNQAGAATAAGRRHVSGKNSAGMPAGAAPSSFQVFPPVQHQAELQVKQCPSSRRGARERPSTGRSTVLAGQPTTSGLNERGGRSTLGLPPSGRESHRRIPSVDAVHGSVRQMVGYVYHRSSMRFSEVPVPEKIGPPVPIVEVDLGYRVAIVEEAVFRRIRKIVDQILDKAIFDEVPRKARIEAHRAMAKVMAGVGRHIDAAHLVPDMVTDIVYRAVERSDATKLAQEILQDVFEGVNRHASRVHGLKNALDASPFVNSDVPVMKTEYWQSLVPSPRTVERVAGEWKRRQIEGKREKSLAATRSSYSCGFHIRPKLIAFRGIPEESHGSSGEAGKPGVTASVNKSRDEARQHKTPGAGALRTTDQDMGMDGHSKASARTKGAATLSDSAPDSDGLTAQNTGRNSEAIGAVEPAEGNWRDNRPEPILVPQDAMPGELPIEVRKTSNAFVLSGDSRSGERLPDTVILPTPDDVAGPSPALSSPTSNRQAEINFGPPGVRRPAASGQQMHLEGVDAGQMRSHPLFEKGRPETPKAGSGTSLLQEAGYSTTLWPSNGASGVRRPAGSQAPKPAPGQVPLQSRTHDGQAKPNVSGLPSWSSEVRAADAQPAMLRKYSELQWPDSPNLGSPKHDRSRSTSLDVSEHSSPVSSFMGLPSYSPVGSRSGSHRKLHGSLVGNSQEEHPLASIAQRPDRQPKSPKREHQLQINASEVPSVEHFAGSYAADFPAHRQLPSPQLPAPMGLTDGYKAAVEGRQQQQQQQQGAGSRDGGLAHQDDNAMSSLAQYYYAIATEKRLSEGLQSLSLAGSSLSGSRDGVLAGRSHESQGRDLLDNYAAVNLQDKLGSIGGHV